MRYKVFYGEFNHFEFRVFFFLDQWPYQGEIALSTLFTDNWREVNTFCELQRVLAPCEMQTASSRIWTRVVVYIFCDGNHSTKSTSGAKSYQSICPPPAWQWSTTHKQQDKRNNRLIRVDNFTTSSILTSFSTFRLSSLRPHEKGFKKQTLCQCQESENYWDEVAQRTVNSFTKQGYMLSFESGISLLR